LADVAGALPRVLQQLGHDVRLVIPRYGDIDPRFRLLPLMPEIKVRWGDEFLTGSVLRCDYPGSRMPVYFIDEPSFSWRKGIYGTGKADFADNDRRFAFFSMAALWLVKGLDWQPDVVHANDWQTGLVPALLKHHHELAEDPFFKNIKSVFAIHNMAYQGNADKFVLPQIGLPWDIFTQDGMEFYGKASYLKSGIAYADAVVTVSPTYAKEIQTEEMGAGMHGTLQRRSDDLYGILNGIDTTEWNPETDPSLSSRFTQTTLRGKAECKAELQKLSGLPVDPTVPLVGMASRLVAQKGFKLIADALDQLLAMDAQFVVLGTGDEEFEKVFADAAEAHPTRIHLRLAYDVPFSHRLIAGSDLFLMPSLFEPCGLTQLYSMRYGTVPVVRRTGGLADSVVPYPVEGATGFAFEEATPEAMVEAVRSALIVYATDKASWELIRSNGMATDWSWNAAAGQYINLYKKLAEV
jgi:starch synthase